MITDAPSPAQTVAKGILFAFTLLGLVTALGLTFLLYVFDAFGCEHRELTCGGAEVIGALILLPLSGAIGLGLAIGGLVTRVASRSVWLGVSGAVTQVLGGVVAVALPFTL